jgi:hypothetical protein
LVFRYQRKQFQKYVPQKFAVRTACCFGRDFYDARRDLLENLLSIAVEVMPRMMRLLVVLRNAACFFVGLAAVAACLGMAAPFPRIGNLWRKYLHFSENHANYSLLYIGSSRVFHEFIPAEFDAVLTAHGHQMKSFNFGQDGMWPPESLYMLRRLMAENPRGSVRWVFFDLMNIKPQIDDNEATERAMYWHDFRHTMLAWRHIWTVPMEGQRTWREKSALSWLHAELWVERTFSLGVGNRAVNLALKLDRDRRPASVENEGFEPGKNGPLEGADLMLFEREVAALRAGVPSKPIPPSLDALVQEVRAAGAEPVFVVASGIHGAERFSDWPPKGVKVMAFDDPVRFPALYNPARRYDPHHLDPIGASAFTKLLAEEFAAFLKAKP